MKEARRLAEQKPAELLPLQVNISGEFSKSGVLPADALAVAQTVAALPRERLCLRGLMAIPEPVHDPGAQRVPRPVSRELMAGLNSHGQQLDTLSIGMSADLEAAVAEAATVVRVSNALFGSRQGTG